MLRHHNSHIHRFRRGKRLNVHWGARSICDDGHTRFFFFFMINFFVKHVLEILKTHTHTHTDTNSSSSPKSLPFCVKKKPGERYWNLFARNKNVFSVCHFLSFMSKGERPLISATSVWMVYFSQQQQQQQQKMIIVFFLSFGEGEKGSASKVFDRERKPREFIFLEEQKKKRKKYKNKQKTNKWTNLVENIAIRTHNVRVLTAVPNPGLWIQVALATNTVPFVVIGRPPWTFYLFFFFLVVICIC